MQPADLLVDRRQPGGGAGDVPARIERALDPGDRGACGGAEGLCLAAAGRAFGDCVKRRFGKRDLVERLDRLGGVHRPFDEVASDRHQLAQQRQVVNLRGELARGEEPLAVGGEPCEIADPAHLPERLVGFEIGPQRHRGDDSLAIEQLDDALVEARVDRLEEMHRRKPGRKLLDHPVVDQHRTEEGSLRLDVGGQRACGGLGGPGENSGFGHERRVMRRARAKGKPAPRAAACG